jgi:antitoxin component YwqK of YwqJK toxin-antitoxin module
MSLTPTPDEKDAQGRKTGMWTEPDPHGGVMVGEYVEGERHGVWRHYFADGTLRAEGGFEHGKVHGEWVWYRSSGGVMQRGGFDHDQKHGTWTRWNAAGQLIDSGDYDNGKKAGEWTTYNPDGTVKRTVTHRPRRSG